MEAVEDAYLEAAIGWLVQTILGSLQIDKLEAWIRQVGLADDIEKLKSEVERVEMVVAAVKGRAIGNRPLARSLARLKEFLYDADDVIDELDYYRLQQQVEGVTLGEPEGMHGAERDEGSSGNFDIPSSSGAKKRSKAWENFEITKKENGKAVEAKCIHCDAPPIKCGSINGTSVLLNHLNSKGCKKKRGARDQPPNPSSIGDATANVTPVVIGNSSSRKRRRTDEQSAHITAANTHHPSNKAELSNRIQEITRQLQDIRLVVSEVLKMLGSDSGASSNLYKSTPTDPSLRTSSVVQRKVYGRGAEKNSIMKLMSEDRPDGVTVLPIIGSAGVGKTALAQHVYNDPTVENQFERIWIWVSHNFDELRLTREMLDFVSRKRHEGSPKKNERHQGISSFAKLQQILKGYMEFQSKRFLLILDDVWDNLDDYRWNKLLAPLISSHVKGNVILVTTRNLSVAQRIGTLEPVKLGALENDDFWLLFKSRAFGDENYEGHQNLSIIGRQIAQKLKGNPLAADSTGELLRKKLDTDHWSNILKNEDWKSLQLGRGIMPSLKLSYDQLPYHLQQCFSYCSIFPDNYQFLGEELVHIWISKGFVKCNHSSKRLEEIGQYYLTDLVNLGFFEQVKEESYLGSQTWYAMCGLMHDFARMVSLTECATIDGLQCNKMSLTIRHLSIVTDSAYSKDQHGNIPRNKDFEENLRNTVTSATKLRTLVLIGQYDSFFFQSLQDIFQKAQNLRVLQMSATSADFNSLMRSSVNPTHLRYLKHQSNQMFGRLRDWPQVFSRFYHLQVLDTASYTNISIPDCMDNLVSLRHLVAHPGVYSSIARIGNMTSLQELQDFSVQDSSGFEITQLQSMNELVQLGVSQLENVKTREEAYGAKLRDKLHLKKLHLSWKWNDTFSEDDYNGSEDDYDSDMSSELSPLDCSGPSSETFIDTVTEVLEGLEPNLDLKHLRISGYNGATSPTWLASNISLTSLHTLHIKGCGKWKILPPLERLPFLTKLKLNNMREVTEISVPSLEKLVLIEMPKLERCSCTSVGDLNSSLRVLKIINCHALKVFDLFENGHKMYLTQLSVEEGENSQSNLISALEASFSALTSSLPPDVSKKGLSGFTSLKNLTIQECPELLSSLVHKDGNDDRANGRWLLPRSLGQLDIDGVSPGTLQPCFLENVTCLTKLDVLFSPSLKSLQLHSCTALEELTIVSCKLLVTLEGLQSLGSLRRLEVYECPRLRPCLERLSMQGPELCPRLSRLETLHIDDTSLLTTSFCKHLSSLQCLQLSWLSFRETRLTDEQEMALQFLTSLQELKFYECEKLTDLPVGLCSLPSLKRLQINWCKGISRLPEMALPHSLEELDIIRCSEELNRECCKLATSKLKVKIDRKYIN